MNLDKSRNRPALGIYYGRLSSEWTPILCQCVSCCRTQLKRHFSTGIPKDEYATFKFGEAVPFSPPSNPVIVVSGLRRLGDV